MNNCIQCGCEVQGTVICGACFEMQQDDFDGSYKCVLHWSCGNRVERYNHRCDECSEAIKAEHSEVADSDEFELEEVDDVVGGTTWMAAVRRRIEREEAALSTQELLR